MKDTHRHSSQTRDDLTGEHRQGDAGQIVLACIFAAVWVADTFIFKYTTFLNQHVPLAIRIPLAAAFLFLSGYLARTGLSIVFHEVRNRPAVIRKGVFGLVRHPIYLGEILLYPGFLMMSLSLAATSVWLLVMGFLHYVSRHEERLLLARFDTEYRLYMQEVPMWIPRLRRRRKT